ncbi:MAG: cyclohexanecarboxylate-CoA ligase [Kaistia sp. SCN 65-12]|nr:MAG: cyclohexanecarboxylate-CoA ligase [Kaistia sp. SCN 65-12]
MHPYLTLHDPARAAAYYAGGLWQSDTFYGLLSRHAEARPEALALRDGRHQLTWGQLREWVDGVAAELRTYGLAGGDRMAIWMSNRAEAIVSFLACSREGIACNPSLHRTYTCREVGILLERLSCRALLTESGWGADRDRANFDAVLSGVSSIKVVFTPQLFPRPGPNRMPPCDTPDKVTYLAFTSGTTGAPKCVMHSDNTLLANARDLVRDWGHGPETVMMSLSPLSHHIAWVAVAQWLLTGCRLVTDDPPAGISQLDWIIQTEATYLLGVPTHAIDVLAALDASGQPKLGSVKLFYMAGSAIAPSLAESLVQRGITPQNVYGMTENSSHQYTHPLDDPEIIVTTCGRGGRAYEICLFDPSDPDRPVPQGEVGEIGGRGAALMLGYFDNQGATERSFNRDGWFLSGDLGVVDEHGNLQVRGRLKEVIIRGGRNIYPAHIENAAARHVGVEAAICFPIADDRLGERVCIAIIGNVSATQLLEHLATEGLSKYDMPEFFVRVTSYPLTASGKVLRRSLVEMVRRRELVPEPLRIIRYSVSQRSSAEQVH